MKKLLRKEIKVNRIFFIVVFLLPLVSFIFAFIEDKLQAYLMFTYFIAFSAIVTVETTIADKNIKVIDILFLSLPIDRDHIIKSKYIASGLIPLIYSLFLYFFYAIVK